MNEKTKAYLAALSFSAIIGFSFLFTKIALGYASPLTNLAHRYTIAALVMVVLHQTKLIKVRNLQEAGKLELVRQEREKQVSIAASFIGNEKAFINLKE